MIALQIHTIGRERIRRMLAGLQTRFRNLQPLFDEIGAAVVRQTKKRFEQQRGPDGTTWEPGRKQWDHAAKTKTKGDAKAKRGPKILLDSGRLWRSVTHVATTQNVSVGSNLVYARIHQLGGTIRPKRGRYLVFRVGGAFVRVSQVVIPARPYLGLNPADERGIMRIIIDWIRRGQR